MELSLELKQVQKLSPQMIQSMQLLQMGTLELQEYVEKALLENPALEREPAREREEGPELLRKLEWLAASDRQNHWYHREDARDLAELAADPGGESLYDHLRSQLAVERLPCRQRRAVECVLTGLSGNGYLEESEAELAARCGLHCSDIRAAVALVQELEPAGVGARTLSECLALQLRRRGETGLALTIAERYLEDVAKSHYHRISRETGADREEIQRACALIRTLEPRPGAAYSPREAAEYIAPDLLVTEADGQLTVTAAEGMCPELKVSGYYQQMLRDTDDEQVREYLTNKVRQATWMVKGIEQRRSTLLSCARSILARQARFFRQGAGNLRPMTLADVAGDVGVHESTVSRAVKDKYIQCAFGVFPLGYFFSRALPAATEGGVAPDGAKAMIRRLIAREDKTRPLSDQKLCGLMGKAGLLLSRRTVAKYREELGIPCAAGRKKFP